MGKLLLLDTVTVNIPFFSFFSRTKQSFVKQILFSGIILFIDVETKRTLYSQKFAAAISSVVWFNAPDLGEESPIEVSVKFHLKSHDPT